MKNFLMFRFFKGSVTVRKLAILFVIKIYASWVFRIFKACLPLAKFLES